MSYRDKPQRGSFYGDKRQGGPRPSRQRESERGRGEERKTDSEGRKPVEVGKEYRVRVIDRSIRGEGVARIEGFIVFIRGAKPGEEVTVRITSVGARAATAEVVPTSPQPVPQ